MALCRALIQGKTFGVKKRHYHEEEYKLMSQKITIKKTFYTSLTALALLGAATTGVTLFNADGGQTVHADSTPITPGDSTNIDENGSTTDNAADATTTPDASVGSIDVSFYTKDADGNETTVETTTFEDQDGAQITATVPDGYTLVGDNTFTIEGGNAQLGSVEVKPIVTESAPTAQDDTSVTITDPASTDAMVTYNDDATTPNGLSVVALSDASEHAEQVLDTSTWTAASYEPLEALIDQMKAIYSDSSSTTQAQIDELTAKIIKATDNLVEGPYILPVEYDEYISDADGNVTVKVLDNQTFTIDKGDSYNLIKDIPGYTLDYVVPAGVEGQPAVKAQGDYEYIRHYDAPHLGVDGKVHVAYVKNAVDKSKLSDALTAGKQYASKTYVDATYRVLQQAITDAQAVKANADATQAQVDAANQSLQSAIAGLKKAPVTNKAELDANLDSYASMTTEGYTTNTFAKVTAALAAGKKVSADINASQATVDSATRAIQDAVSSLQLTPDQLIDDPDATELEQNADSAATDDADSTKDADESTPTSDAETNSDIDDTGAITSSQDNLLASKSNQRANDNKDADKQDLRMQADSKATMKHEASAKQSATNDKQATTNDKNAFPKTGEATSNLSIFGSITIALSALLGLAYKKQRN